MIKIQTIYIANELRDKALKFIKNHETLGYLCETEEGRERLIGDMKRELKNLIINDTDISKTI